MCKILICFGTRPEFIKLEPLIKKMEGVIEYKTLFTGQHVDLVRHEPDYRIEIQDGGNRLDSIVSSVMNGIDFNGITAVIVQGDTTSAYAVALSAFHHQIPVIHLEAGLRTYNLEQPYPEEANRQMISRIASIHLCPTKLAKELLVQENVSGNIQVVGNTVLDNLVGIKPSNKNQVLVTMHRRENHKNIEKWFSQIDKLSRQYTNYEFLLPIHPNPAVKKFSSLLKSVTVVEPMAYDDLITYLSQCSFVVTDSGGIQEEAAFFRKPCLVCREETERKEGLDNFSLLCERPELLSQRFEALKPLQMHGPCPYGDGKASEKIIEILTNCFLQLKENVG